MRRLEVGDQVSKAIDGDDFPDEGSFRAPWLRPIEKEHPFLRRTEPLDRNASREVSRYRRKHVTAVERVGDVRGEIPLLGDRRRPTAPRRQTEHTVVGTDEKMSIGRHHE